MNSRLHILNKAPDHPRYRQCLAALEAGDVLVLIESGVLLLADEARFQSALDNVQVYAIAGDLEAYSSIPGPESTAETIEYQALVELVWRVGSPVSW